MLIAALLTIPAVGIEQSDAGEPWDSVAVYLNWGIWLAFLAEALLMLRAVDDRWKWLRDHPLEVAIILLTPPFLRRACKPREYSGFYDCSGWFAPPFSCGDSCPPKACAMPPCWLP